MEKLTKSPRLNKLLYQMGIYNYYDVVYHLPKRYENLNFTEERNLVDKQRVVIIGRLVSAPKLVLTKRVKLVTFEFLTRRGTYFKVVAFNRQYLTNMLNMKDEFTLIGSFSKKDNEINLINIH